MNATADIQTDYVENALSVPIQSVATRNINEDSIGLEEELVEFVFVATDGQARQTRVTTGIQDDMYIEVKTGVTDGEKVVTAPYNAVSRELKDGDGLEIVSKQELYRKDK